METDTAVVNSQGTALFNFMSMKHQNDKRVGELTIGDFFEMAAFLAELEIENAAN
jgi:hypothetical protein